MAVTLVTTIKKYIGLSSDTKPSGVPVGTLFYEKDTKIVKIFDGSNWQVKPGGGF